MEPTVTPARGDREIIGPIITPDGAAWFRCPDCGIPASDPDELRECPECARAVEEAARLARERYAREKYGHGR